MAAFSTTRTLAFGDCDPSGIAYFPTYLDYLVQVLEAFFADLGHPWPQMTRDLRIGTPTVTLNLTFEAPGFHGDEMTFHLDVVKVGRTSLDLRHRVEAGGRVLWRAEHRIVATSLDTHRPIPWPADVKAALEARMSDDPA